jgi:hypothetical protein
MDTAIATLPPPVEIVAAPFNAFGSIEAFSTAQRMARCLSSSTIVPETYRGEENLGNCVIALEMANRIGANVLSVMQNLYIVHGRPAWSSQFLISCVNASRRFSPLRYALSEPGPERDVAFSYTVYVGGNKQRKEGAVKVRDRSCVAWALDKTGERLERGLIIDNQGSLDRALCSPPLWPRPSPGNPPSMAASPRWSHRRRRQRQAR